MSVERELLQEALEWMHELKYVWANVRDAGDYDLLDLIAGINKIEKLLAQPERKPLEFEIDGSFEYRDGFIDGVSYAEKAHGIGVDDEDN